MGKTPHYLRTFKVTPRKHRRVFGDLDLFALAREIDRGWRFFCAARGMNPDRIDAHGGPSGRVRDENNKAAAVAAHYLSIDNPPRGLLARMARDTGLAPHEVTLAAAKLRKARAIRREAAA